MAGRIPQAFIDELIARADIVEIIGSRVPLKRAGREYKACCPFHDEKTASFWVSPDKQFYHCFGCGAHGTALGFLMEYDRLPFPEAVEDLAGRLGLTVPHEASGSPGSRGVHRPAAAALARKTARRCMSCWPRWQISIAPCCSVASAPGATRLNVALRPPPSSVSHRLCERFVERCAAPLRRA